MSTSIASAPLPGDVNPEAVLGHLLDVSLTGIQLLRPVYAPDGSTIINFAFAYTNPAGLRIFGVTQPLSGTLLERFPHTHAAGVLAYYQRAFASDEPLAYEVNYQADGVDNYLRFQARRSGAHLLVSFTDTSDQPHTAVEEALHQVQEREDLYQVFAQAPAVVLLLRGPQHRIDYVNGAGEQLFPGRHLRGRSLLESQPEAVAQGFVALLDQVYRTGETYLGTEVPLTVPEGSGQAARTTYLNFSYQAYREQNQIVGVSVFAHDVTEQVLARQQREAQQHLLATVFTQAPTAIWVTRGPDYIFELVNPLMEQLLGSSQADLLGRPYFVALPGLVGQGIPELMAQAWQGEVVYAQEYMARLSYHAEGEIGYFSFVFQPLRDAQGLVSRLACVATDVTAQVHARQQVQELNAELAATNQELLDTNARLTRSNVDLDTFVYTASHDLKAPITNIEGILLALRDTLPAAVQQDELVAHLFGLLDNTVNRFQFTIRQLTDITRLQLAHAGPAEPVVLAQVVGDVRLDIAPLLLAAGTQLTVEVPPDLVVSFAPANLRSVVYNLLSNAVKYRSPERPSVVQVRAAQAPGAVVLAVQDNGLGMSQVQQRQLFGLFQRLHTHVEGTGVGLYISKRLIENAGGTIQVQSQPGQGTTFTVTFPA